MYEMLYRICFCAIVKSKTINLLADCKKFVGVLWRLLLFYARSVQAGNPFWIPCLNTLFMEDRTWAVPHFHLAVRGRDLATHDT